MNHSAPGNADKHGESLAARFAEAPHIAASVTDQGRFESWLAGLEPAQSARLEALLAHPLARNILSGITEFSPYLFELARADTLRLIRLLECDPDAHLATLIAEASGAVLAASDEAEVMRLLRRMKAEAALLTALCDIGGVWPVMRVTAALTDVAVSSVQAALQYLLRQEAARGKLLPPNPEAPEEGCGLIVLAMGKMGAGELNYSSDIDLIVFFDPDNTTLAADIEPQPFFVRVTQGMARILQQRTYDGYVFRVDLRLRPDPSSTQVAISRDAALNYYEREGAHLGARRDDQGASLRRRSQSGRGAARGDRALRLAQASRFRRACRRPRHEAADADLSRPERGRGRRA
ncbi:glutamine synthetase adenylyltransferase [Bradyrhizobium sp. LM6.10]